MFETLAVETLPDQTGDRNSSTLYTMPITWQTRFLEMSASALVGSLISQQTMGEPYRPFCFLSIHPWHTIFVQVKKFFKFFVCYIGWNSFNCRLFVCSLLNWKAFGRLILTFLPRAAFILFSFCNIVTSCTESPIAKKSPFGSSLISEVLGIYVSVGGSKHLVVIADWLVCIEDLSGLSLDGDVFLAGFFFSLFFCSISFQMAGNLNDIPLMWCLFSSE